MKSEEEKYAELIISLTKDFLLGRIDFNHYADTLDTINKNIQKMHYEDNQRAADDLINDF